MTTLSFQSHLLCLHLIICFTLLFLSTIKFWPAGMDSRTVTANQNGQDANTDLPLLSSLPLLCGSPSLLFILPPRWPGVFLLSFYLFKVSVQSYTLSPLHRSDCGCIASWCGTNLLPSPHLSPSLCCLFPLRRVLHRKHTLSRGDLKSLFLWRANCHTEMRVHTSMWPNLCSELCGELYIGEE